MDDGKKIYETRMSDASLPMSLRTEGEFLTYLSEDNRKLFPSGEAVDAEKITIAVQSATPGKGGAIKFKGPTQAGHVPIDKLTGTDQPKPAGPPSKS